MELEDYLREHFPPQVGKVEIPDTCCLAGEPPEPSEEESYDVDEELTTALSLLDNCVKVLKDLGQYTFIDAELELKALGVLTEAEQFLDSFDHK